MQFFLSILSAAAFIPTIMGLLSKIMGQSSSTPVGLGSHSTAKQVIEEFGEGQYLDGKTAIVTGGNSGIGLETCKALALAGCKVVLCSRSVAAGEAAIKKELELPGEGGYTVREAVAAGKVVVRPLDLASLTSVKAFAEEFISTESRLDFLVLNAGIMALPKREETDAGFEKQIGVNHFGHFYLTQLLKSKLAGTPDTAGRVVVLSSSAHAIGSVKPEDLHYSKGRSYRAWEAYGQSKLANLLFAKGLADRCLEDADPNVQRLTAAAVHPGVIQTNLWQQSFFNRLAGNLITSKSIPQGAATTVFACVAPRVGTEALRGAYLEDCRPSLPNEAGQDANKQLRNALWAATEEQLAEAVKKM